MKPRGIVDGQPWWDFLFEYDWDGRTYSFVICAPSEEEAMARLKRLPASWLSANLAVFKRRGR
jgi:hypothetical protein